MFGGISLHGKTKGTQKVKMFHHSKQNYVYSSRKNSDPK